MIPEINYIAVILATLSSMVVGSIWYAEKVFGARWMKLSGMTREDTQTGFVKALVITLIVSFITALVLAGTATIVHDLTVLNVAHELVTLVVMALIIGVWPA